MQRFIRMFLFVGMCLVLPGITESDTKNTDPKQGLSLNFRKSAKGVALEARSGVPISGVVLYEPAGGRGPSNPLDYVSADRRCNQDAYGNTQNETPGAANPINMDIILAGANDYRNPDRYASGGFYCSTDKGDSWFDALVTRGPADYDYDAAGDPVTCIDRNGRMYVAYIAFDDDLFSTENGVYVQTSTDNGLSWSDPATVIEHRGTSYYDFEDKPYATCDYAPASPYVNNFYITWTKIPIDTGALIYFSRSTDGGASFSTPTRLSTSSYCHFSCPTVGPNGEVYAVWFDYNSSNIMFDRSTDGGVTWGPDIAVASFNNSFPTNPCGTFRTPSYPVIGCDISGGPYNGWLYVCWADASGGDPDIYFSRSTDGGSTWSSPSIVNDDGTSRWQWWQWLAVHPTTGYIGMSWLDRREDPAGCEFNTYATESRDGGTTWLPNFPVSDVASDPSSVEWMGDYCGTTFADSGFYSVWVDLRNEGGTRPGDAYACWWYGLSSTVAVVRVSGSDIWLHWNSTGMPYYHIYSYATPFASDSTFVNSTTDTFYQDLGASTLDSVGFYRVFSSDQP